MNKIIDVKDAEKLAGKLGKIRKEINQIDKECDNLALKFLSRS